MKHITRIVFNKTTSFYWTKQQYFKEFVGSENYDTKKSEMINVHILCSNCPPPAATHARSLFRHSPTALSIMRCSSLSHSSSIRRRSSSTSCLSCKLVLAVRPRSCSRLGSDRGCWVGTNLVEWSLASRLSGVQQFREPDAPGAPSCWNVK